MTADSNRQKNELCGRLKNILNRTMVFAGHYLSQGILLTDHFAEKTVVTMIKNRIFSPRAQ
jgi:hypothetical protein